MSLSYDTDNLSITFTIGDFPEDVQNELQSTLDINGFISNEPKFREIVAANIGKVKGVNPKEIEKLLPIIRVGNLLTLERDAEKNQFGLNFALNKYLISLDVVPGRAEVKKTGTKTLAIIGVSKSNDYYLTAYEDEDGNYRYAGRIEPFLAREKLFVEPIEESGDVLWIDPKKFKKVKVTHTEANYSLEDTFAIGDKVVNLGKKLSAIASDMKMVELVDTPAPISQLIPVEVEAKMPHLKEIQQIVKDKAWQKLREDLSWTKDNIGSSLRRLRQYMSSDPSRKRKVRVLNLLNGVARGGIMNDQIKRMQLRLRKDIGVGVKEAALRDRICAWCGKLMGQVEVPDEMEDSTHPTHGVCEDCAKKVAKDLHKEAAKSPKELINKLQEISHRVSLWNNPAWSELFRNISSKLISERKVYNPADKEELRQRIVEELLSKGSSTSPAETSLIKMLNGPQGGMSLADRFIELLIDQVNTRLQLDAIHEEAPMLEKEAVSKTPPIAEAESNGHKYIARVKESERTTAMGNWKIEIDEDGKTIISTKLVKWPGKDYELADTFVMTDTGKWEDADSDDLNDIEKLKELLITLATRYENWSKEVGPKSELGDTDYWKSYDDLHGIDKEAAAYNWKYSPMKGGEYGRMAWLVPAILEQTRLKDDKWDPGPLTEGDLYLLREAVKRGRRGASELSRETNYHNEWYAGKWSDKDKENIRNEVWERVTAAYQERNKGQYPPFLKDPFKPGDLVVVLQGPNNGKEGTVVSVNPAVNAARVRFGTNESESVPVPYQHLKLLPKPEKPAKPEEPVEEKRPYTFVKEELENLLKNYQPGNWLGFMNGISPKGTKAEQLMHFYRERALFKRDFPTGQEIMERLQVDQTAVSHLCRSLMERAQKASTADGARELMGPKKKAAFMPSLPSQPFWDQHNDGGGTGDYKYPLENLYPREWWDTWNAYTKMNAKVDPSILMNLLRKLKPLSKEDKSKAAPLEKVAILEMDPDIAVRFYHPFISFTMPDDSGIGGEYEATLINKRPSSAAEKIQGVDPEKEKKVPYLGKTPAERIQEGKIPVLPIPQEGDRAPIYFIPGIGKRIPNDKPFKPLADTGEVIYQVKLVNKDPNTPDTVIGYFDAMDFLTHTVKKGNERKGLQDWLIKRIEASAPQIKKLLTIAGPGRELKDRISWKARVYQAIISEEWDAAKEAIKDSGLPEVSREGSEKVVASYQMNQLLRDMQYEEIPALVKKYKVLPMSWKGVTPEQQKERLDLIPILNGKTAKPASAEFTNQANLILNGNDSYPKGGSIDAKRKVIRDVSVPRLLEFILGDSFLSQPFAVQSAAVRRLEASGTSGEEGLFAVWKKKDLPATLRKEALNALVLAYGVGTASRGYSEEGRFKATKNLLTEAAEDTDADIRAAAYSLMKDPSVDFLPWTNQGKLTYSPSKALTKKDQPSKDIPDWMIVQLRNEPYSELRTILFDLIEELPKNLITEEQPPKLSSDLKITTHGKYAFKEELLPGVAQLLLTALTDSDPRVRARVRSYFNLPRELDLLKKEKAEPKVIEPSAKDYIFHAKVSLNQNNIDDAEKQLAAATKANNAADYKEEIESLKKRIADAREDAKSKEESGKKVEELHKSLVTKYPDLSSDNAKAFLDWASRLKYQTTFEGLSIKNKEDVLSFLAKDSTWYEHWKKSPASPADKVIQPELPLQPEDSDETAFEKRGSPLSFRELTSRQPPTTWQLDNPGPGYSSAFPLGAKDDDLLLKDVRQFYGRPNGKWRSLLNKVYDMLFKKEEEEQEEKKELKKIAEELPKDEEGLIAAVKKDPDNKPLLRQILQQAEKEGFIKVIQAVMDLPYPASPATDDIHYDAIRMLYRMKAIPELGQLLFTPWHPAAIKYLASLGQSEALKSTFKARADRPSLQRNIVLYVGEAGDVDFLTEALKSPNAPVRQQAIEWLKHHKRYDVLKKHLGEEKDDKTKAIIEKSLAMADEGSAADALPEMSSEEQEKKISELIKTATDAFTRWEKYPEVRREVLGKGGRRYGISTFNDWATAQEEIDNEINEKMEEIPSIAEGREALKELDKIVQKLPDATKRIVRLREWVTEAEEKYNSNKNRQPNVSDEQWEKIQEGLNQLHQRIVDARENLRKFEGGLKADLSFRVGQLRLLEQAAIYRESLIDILTKDNQFKKDYGLSSKTWKDYQAYLMTFDKNLETPYVGAHDLAKGTFKGIIDLEKKRKELEEKEAKPLKENLASELKASEQLSHKLIPFYKKLGISVDKDNQPIAPGTSTLKDQLHQYQQLEEQWYKLSGAVEPYADVDDVKYRIAPALWVLPKDTETLPEYGRGKRLVHDQVSELKSPWSTLIKDIDKKLRKLDREFKLKIADKMPEQGKEFFTENVECERKIKKLRDALGTIGVSTPSEARADKERAAAKKEYEAENRALLKRVQQGSDLKEKNPEEYIKLQVALKEFMNKYGLPPVPEGPEANLKKQYFYDRWRSPMIRGPQSPQIVTPGPEEAPYSGRRDYTDEERKRIEQEIARRIKEYGPTKPEDDR